MATTRPNGPSAAGAALLLRNARVWPHPDQPVGEPTSVVVRDGVIRHVGTVPEGSEPLPTLDVDGRVLTAGFVNCHVHFTEGIWARRQRADRAAIQSALDDMLLSRGFTTVLDLASNPRDTAALIRRIETGELRGPRILTAGAGIRPWAGTPFYVKASVPWFVRVLMPSPATALGARLTVAMQARAGARLTKLFTGSYVTPARVKPMRTAIARAAVAAAHRRGTRVLAHPSNRAGTAVAIDAGVDALAHVPDETAGTAELLTRAARDGVRVVPTLHMFASTVTADDAYLAPIRDALRGFVAAGGRVLFGTDVGYMDDRDTRPEFEALHDSGLDSADILRSLTAEPASFLRWNDAGTVAPGFRADLTIMETRAADPRPSDFADVHAVVKDGDLMYRAP